MYSSLQPSLPSQLSVLKSGGLAPNVSIASVLRHRKLSMILLIPFGCRCELSAWKKNSTQVWIGAFAWAHMLAVFKLELGSVFEPRRGYPGQAYIWVTLASTMTKPREAVGWLEGP